MKLSHKPFEKHSMILLIGILIVVAIGGLIQIAPLFWLWSTIKNLALGSSPLREVKQ
jgi:cytochrome c oxidase cbb3-type subunit 2